MPVDLFTFIDLYQRQLDAVAHLLAKGTAHAEAHGIPERDMLDWRLAEDMHPLAFQVSVVINFSRRWSARVAGIAEPVAIEHTLDVAGFQDAIVAAKAWLAALTREQFAARDDMPMAFEIMPGMVPTMTGARWLTSFATTNVYFHAAMVYAILRSRGVAIGKVDMFPGGL